MTSLAIMQPVYLPWLGYFEQMALCDTFIFLDDVQYTKQDWRNRNRIRTKDGWCWLTIPVQKADLKSRLCDITISNHKNWTRTHLLSIAQNYGRAPFFDKIFSILECAFGRSPDCLADLTIGLTKDFAAMLQIKTPTLRASKIPGKATDPVARIIELCNYAQADVFYTGQAAQSYLDPADLRAKGIDLVFQDYKHPVYQQCYPGFESHMAILDLLMNHGSDARDILLSSPVSDKLLS